MLPPIEREPLGDTVQLATPSSDCKESKYFLKWISDPLLFKSIGHQVDEKSLEGAVNEEKYLICKLSPSLGE
jgi:hypothetical protein